MNEELKTYIVLDESGAMHLKNERYFVIAGYITQENHKITSMHKKIEKEIKQNRGIPLDQKIELKSSNTSPTEQAKFLNSFNSIETSIPICIVVDKFNLRKFKANENLAYNYFVKTLITYLYIRKVPYMNTSNIELRLDNRSIAVKHREDLKDNLNNCFKDKNTKFEVKYLDSKNNRDIQIADNIANYVWQIYNYPNTEKIYKQAPLLHNRMLESRFPFKEFGTDMYLSIYTQKEKETVEN